MTLLSFPPETEMIVRTVALWLVALTVVILAVDLAYQRWGRR